MGGTRLPLSKRIDDLSPNLLFPPISASEMTDDGSSYKELLPGSNPTYQELVPCSTSVPGSTAMTVMGNHQNPQNTQNPQMPQMPQIPPEFANPYYFGCYNMYNMAFGGMMPMMMQPDMATGQMSPSFQQQMQPYYGNAFIPVPGASPMGSPAFPMMQRPAAAGSPMYPMMGHPGYPMAMMVPPQDADDQQKHKKFSDHVIKTLIARYELKPFIEKSERIALARSLGLKHEQIKIWFQNRRYKDKKRGGNTQLGENSQSESPEEHKILNPIPMIHSSTSALY